MKTFIFVYEGFVQFEVVLAALLMKGKSEIITVSFNREPITSGEGFQIVPHLALSEIDPEDVDLFIVPGGEPQPLLGKTELHHFLQTLNKKEKVIGAICGGPITLGQADLLDNKSFTSNIHEDMPQFFEKATTVDSDVVTDGNIITSRGKAYAEFAMEIGRKMNIFENEQDEVETYNFFKNLA